MANSNKHGKQTLTQGIHGTIAYEYANAAARLAAIGFEAEDLYKQAIQLDDNSVWILYSVSPPLWSPVGSSPTLVQGISAGTAQAQGPNIVFANSNGVSFGANGSTITASVQPGGVGIQAGTQIVSSGTLTFSNSNGITFGISDSVLTASILPGAAAGIGAVQAGTQTQISGTLIFSNSNGITFGLSNSSVVTASYTVPNTNGLISNINISAGTTSNNLSALTFSNSNGLAFGLNGSVITGSYTVPTVPAQSVQTQSNVQGISAGTQVGRTGDIIFSNSNGITFGMANSSVITASYTVPNAPTQTSLNFSNSNNVSFGIDGSTITASASFSQSNQSQGLYVAGNTFGTSSTTVDARSLTINGSGGLSVGYSNGSLVLSVNTAGGGALTNINVSAGTTSNNLSAVTFSNSNGLAFGLNAGTITGSYTVPSTAGLISNINVSAGTTSGNLSNLVVSNSNNVSFGLNGSTLTASASFPSQTNQSVGLYAVGNTTQNSSTTLDARSLSFNGLGNLTVGYSNGSVQISGSQSAQTQNVVVPSVNGSTITAGSIVFSNSNGMSFGLNGSTLTGSYTVPNTAGLLSAIRLSAGTQSSNLSAFTFSNSNGISFGLDNGTITASYTVPTVPSQTSLVFSNSNNVSFGINGSTLTASATFNQSVQTQSNVQGLIAGTQTGRTGDISFVDSNGITFGMAGSNSITASYTVPSTAGLISNINVSAGTTSNNLAALTFSNSNGLAFGLNGSTITGSYTVPTQTNQSIGLYALGNTTQNSSTTLDARSLSFNGLGGNTVGYSNGSIQISGVTTNNLISRINVSAGTTSNNLSAVTFANGNGVSFGLNASTLTASVAAQTNQTLGLFAASNTTQNSSTTLDARSLTIQGAGIASIGYSNGSIIVSVPTGAPSPVNVSAGTTSGNLGSIVLSNSNGVSFGLNGSTITASVQAGPAAGIAAGQAGTQTATSGTLNFVNSNGVTFGMSGSSQITASHNGITSQTNQTVGLYGLGNTTQNSSTTLDARSLSFNGLGAVTVGYSNGSIQISAPTQTQFVLSNSNGIAFGTNGSTVTASYTVPSVPAQTNQSLGLYAVSNTTQNSSTTLDARSLTLQGAGIASVGYSNGSIIISVPSAGANINVSAGTTSNNLNALTFANGNGVSFGIEASTITASISQTNQTVGLYAVGNTTQNSSTTRDARSLSFNGLGAATVGYSNGSVQISVPVQTIQTQSNIQAFYDGANSISTGTIRVSNSNGISFGINGQTLTASHNGITSQTNQTVGLYAIGNTTQNSSTTLDVRSLSFNGLGGNTVGYSNGSIQISGVTTNNLISRINISAGTTSNNLSALTFSNSNGLAFGLNGSVITGSYTTPTQTNQTVGLYALGNTTQNSSTTLDARTLSFNGLGAATVGYSNGSIQVSVPVQTVQTQSNIQAFYDGANSITTGTIRLSNSNGISFGINGQTITASYTVPNIVGLISGINVSAGTTSNNLSALTFSNSNGLAFGLNGSVVTGSYTVPTQTNQTIGLYAVGNTAGQSSSTTIDARSLTFSGSGNITVGYSQGSVIIGQTGGGGQSNQTLGLYALGNTTQNSSSTLDARSLSFNGLGGATVGYSNGSIQMSVPGTSSIVGTGAVSISVDQNSINIGAPYYKVSKMAWPPSPFSTNFAISNASLSLQMFNANNDMTVSQANFLMALSGNTNSSGALTISIGIYTLAGSTMSLASSGSRQISWTSDTQTSASSRYGGVSGTRYRTVSLNNWSVSAGDYMLGIWCRTTNNGTWNVFGQQGPTIVGAVDVNETNHYLNGYSTSSFTTAMIGSVNVTNTNYVRTGADALQQPGLIFLGSY